ncbi:MAG TPA: tetraacyldisaccharide 4'-kinase [Terracidiphilus sp.]|jgi:tetraacyldisaccharide 4'-kinase
MNVRPWLIPLNPLYRLGVSLRDLRLRYGWEPIRHLRYPVISIGNLSTGGAGKTPLTIALARELAARMGVDVLSRGFGRYTKAVARVRPEGTAEEFGDEPLLIARDAGVPVYVANQRYEAGLLAEAQFRSTASQPVVHILDDGFQHRQLHRDIDILILNRADWNDRLLPAGNLREPLHAAHRANILAIPADEPDLEAELRAFGWQGPLWRLRRHMNVPPIVGPVAAFCGIARPDQFFSGLQAAGLHVATRTAFPDHHHYVQHDVDCVLGAARTVKAAAIFTTEKDRVRLAHLAVAFPESMPLKTAGLRIEVDNAVAYLDPLLHQIESLQNRHPADQSSTRTVFHRP